MAKKKKKIDVGASLNLFKMLLPKSVGSQMDINLSDLKDNLLPMLKQSGEFTSEEGTVSYSIENEISIMIQEKTVQVENESKIHYFIHLYFDDPDSTYFDVNMEGLSLKFTLEEIVIGYDGKLFVDSILGWKVLNGKLENMQFQGAAYDVAVSSKSIDIRVEKERFIMDFSPGGIEINAEYDGWLIEGSVGTIVLETGNGSLQISDIDNFNIDISSPEIMGLRIPFPKVRDIEDSGEFRERTRERVAIHFLNEYLLPRLFTEDQSRFIETSDAGRKMEDLLIDYLNMEVLHEKLPDYF